MEKNRSQGFRFHCVGIGASAGGLEAIEAFFSHMPEKSGLLPICAHCKKIRDDQGYWEQLESYLDRHSEIKFSHGICQDCLKKYYPDFCDHADF